MLTIEVEKLVKRIMSEKKETQTIETKAAHGGFPKIYDTLSSFSNQNEGGYIVFGIDETRDFELVGTYKNDVQDLQHRIAEACKQMEPEVRAVISSAEIDGKTVVVAEIPGVEYAKRPVYYKGAGIMNGSYIRVGDADEPMNGYEIYRYEAYRSHVRDDLRPILGVGMDVLNHDKLQKYLIELKLKRENISNLGDETIFKLVGVSKDEHPTLASMMTFAVYPQATLPQLCITAVLVPGTRMGDTTADGQRFISNKKIEGTIAEMVESAVNFVAMNMREQVGFDANGRRIDVPEYPMKAVREIILNALVHRDYSVYTEGMPIRIEMYKDRLEVSNPGGLYGITTVETLGQIKAEARNSTLISFLELLDVVENRFSGVPTIREEMRKAGLPEPIFRDEKGIFTVILYNARHEKRDVLVNAGQNKLLEFCKTPRSRAEITEFCGKTQYYAMKKFVEPLLQQGLLEYTIPEKPKSPAQKFRTVE